jgi:hypothetical protein
MANLLQIGRNVEKCHLGGVRPGGPFLVLTLHPLWPPWTRAIKSKFWWSTHKTGGLKSGGVIFGWGGFGGGGGKKVGSRLKQP